MKDAKLHALRWGLRAAPHVNQNVVAKLHALRRGLCVGLRLDKKMKDAKLPASRRAPRAGPHGNKKMSGAKLPALCRGRRGVPQLTPHSPREPKK